MIVIVDATTAIYEEFILPGQKKKMIWCLGYAWGRLIAFCMS